ncbi:hypothetical protein F0562_028245 [Nyssa sinensis]|uniref:Uncharacterized protein n=1 Tax=Nyssa sinensis TaxID=561372 RepID=A0A5J5BBG5_9ASTE|nr:hypothetical protein F0562_028245 [Nyssa sinensis]
MVWSRRCGDVGDVVANLMGVEARLVMAAMGDAVRDKGRGLGAVCIRWSWVVVVVVVGVGSGGYGGAAEVWMMEVLGMRSPDLLGAETAELWKMMVRDGESGRCCVCEGVALVMVLSTERWATVVVRFGDGRWIR